MLVPERSVFLLMLPLLLLLSSAVHAAAPKAAALEQQRKWFVDARQALKADKTEQFESFKSKLTGYPLLPYLDLWQAQKELQQHRDDRIARVLHEYADIPEAIDLRLAWIKNLAERGQWPHVAEQLAMLPGAEERMPEVAMMTLWRTGRKPEALAIFTLRWQQGYAVSDISAPLERAWMKLGHPSVQERWARIAVMAKKGRWSAVKVLARGLPDKERKWIRQWREMQADPAAGLQQWASQKHALQAMGDVAQAMLGDAVHRLARKDVRQAWTLLHNYHNLFDSDDLATYEQRIALKAAKQHVPEAAEWLAKLSPAKQTKQTRAWRVRLYLLQQDERQVLQAIRAMPEAQQSQHRWLFWKAQALESLGQKAQSQRLFETLARDRGYYSFLSAEHLKQPYRFSPSSFDASDSLREQLTGKAPMQRAYEWWMLGEAGKANREWYLAMQGADVEQWKAAAELAASWGWYDRVIYAAYRAGESDALRYRFPKGYEATVHRLSSQTGLTPSLIWSVIRQESAFNRRAVSRTGARGLMQLMPKTASHVARKNDLSLKPDDLFDARVNIRLGSLYLASLEQRFDGNMALVAAAYNAGPSRVSRWLERTPFEHSAAWIEAIPFNETRRYVQQVLAFTIVYDWLQEKTPTALSARFTSIQPKG